MIRIVGGKYRHRVLDQPSLEITRCSKDSVKEGLFSSLLMQYFKNNGQHTEKVNVNNPYNFYCCNWE